MSKPWHEKPLWWKVFMAADEVYLHAGKIIGHLGCSPFEFFDAAKLLPDYNQHRYENAVRDLTVYAKREASPPRYELTDHAKKVLWIIIGPPPDHPEYREWWERRLISVRQMHAEGIPVPWAEEPPVLLEPTENTTKPKKQTRRRKIG